MHQSSLSMILFLTEVAQMPLFALKQEMKACPSPPSN